MNTDTSSNLSGEKEKAKKKSQADELAECIFSAVPHIMQAIRCDMRTSVHGMTIPQFRILARLELGPTNHRDLAEWIGVSLPAISRMVNLLEDRALVVRDRQRADRRYVHLTLSEEGRAFFKKCKKHGQKSFARRFMNLTAEDAKDIARGLTLLSKAIKQQGEGYEKGDLDRVTDCTLGMRSRTDQC